MSLTNDYDEVTLVFDMYRADSFNVLVLVIARNTHVLMASGIVEVNPIWTAMDAESAKALPAFHAFTGTDNTGRFTGIGKATWLNVYLKADDHVIKAMYMLS